MDWEFFHDRRRFFKSIALEFQSVVDNYREGIAIKISISMPPRAGKSYITSLFACYWLANFPELSVMRNACTATLYDKFSYDTRALIRSEKFKEIFPLIELAPDKQNLGGWNLKTSKQVGYFGAGVGGTIIGFGANIAISDDLYKSMADALSDTTRDKVELWKESAHDSRKEKNCPEIYIGTRWVKDDIIGKIIDSGDLKATIVIPALIDGQSFCEDVKSTDEYLHIKSRIAESTWSAEYMQEPLDIQGLLLPISTLNFSDISIVSNDDFAWNFCICDPADKGGDNLAALFVGVLIRESRCIAVVRDVIYSKTGIEANAQRIVDKSKQYRCDDVIVESNGVGLALVVLLSKMLPKAIKLNPFASTDNKDVRILSHFEFIPTNFIFDEKYEDNQEYLTMLLHATSYLRDGDNSHKKDAIDCLAMAANFIKLKYAKIIYEL